MCCYHWVIVYKQWVKIKADQRLSLLFVEVKVYFTGHEIIRGESKSESERKRVRERRKEGVRMTNISNLTQHNRNQPQQREDTIIQI